MKASKQLNLPEGYKPQHRDILSGRSRESFHHEGNREFRNLIALYLQQYLNYNSRRQRGTIIVSIMNHIQTKGGRFLERKNNRWVSLTSKQARDKVGHALRDAAKDKKMHRIDVESQGGSRQVEDDFSPPIQSRQQQQQQHRQNVEAKIDSLPEPVSSLERVNEVSYTTFHDISYESDSCSKIHHQVVQRCSSSDWTQDLDQLVEESESSDSLSSDDDGSLLWFSGGSSFEPILF